MVLGEIMGFMKIRDVVIDLYLVVDLYVLQNEFSYQWTVTVETRSLKERYTIERHHFPCRDEDHARKLLKDIEGEVGVKYIKEEGHNYD